MNQEKEIFEAHEVEILEIEENAIMTVSTEECPSHES